MGFGLCRFESGLRHHLAGLQCSVRPRSVLLAIPLLLGAYAHHRDQVGVDLPEELNGALLLEMAFTCDIEKEYDSELSNK